ncbi:hypothetical protein ASE48_20155 [Mycobacterium sp. Root265]|uniref:DUF2742 domain-containing protein n=1 Tax=Mycobacterium sp. Root265 TaxID=1736504 RepID=UPI00070F4A47|nr:DUF2742 domain-containing protein [Mycobacterium sp. Root265]KRD04956.1 hypothetical protein ASE48_20155 [Mycobacterium sp. Root265]
MNDNNEVAPGRDAGGYPSSCQVSWFSVYQFAQRWASSRGIDLLSNDLVIPGTPAWCSMSDDDATKLLSLILGGIREALLHDVDQEHRADASRAIAEATDWSTQANRLRGRSGPTYIERRKGVA